MEKSFVFHTYLVYATSKAILESHLAFVAAGITYD